VKRCGKSAPRLRQRRRHGKPHREQDRIGTARRPPPRERKRSSGSMSGSGRPGRLLKAPGNRRRRGMVVTRGASLASQNPAYRPADALQGGSAENHRAPANFDPLPSFQKPRHSWVQIALIDEPDRGDPSPELSLILSLRLAKLAARNGCGTEKGPRRRAKVRGCRDGKAP
jgi:hypothetical protein